MVSGLHSAHFRGGYILILDSHINYITLECSSYLEIVSDLSVDQRYLFDGDQLTSWHLGEHQMLSAMNQPMVHHP